MTPLVKLFARLLGLALLVFGVAGFVAGGSLFDIALSTVQSAVYVVMGLLALAVASKYSSARMFLLLFGLLFALAALFGYAMGGDILGLFRTNMYGNHLHAVLGALCLFVGFGSKSKV